MPVRVAFKPLLEKIWHAPDNFQFMEPLPLMHRRGIFIGALLIVLGLLLPGGGSSVPAQEDSPREAQLNIQSQTAEQPTGSVANPQEQLDAAMPDSDPGTEGDAEPPPQASVNNAANAGNNNNAGFHPGGIEEQWRSYRLGSGTTLAQLFRDNGLPPADVYAMAQVEGDGKPLSNLQSGQIVKIRQNAGGVVTGLAIESGNGEVLFTRQSNGSFNRVR
ncbi:opacity-associated protein OapA [Salmonella enterica subsp. enterica serovar Choleraesuis]|nr:opacity-associated protein OapA [Salmonella enterica subsp. enterica serovar Choleraesuis]